MRLSEVDDINPLYDALFAAATELGIPINPDYNGADQEGIVRTQTTISNGKRMSSAVAYLDPVRGRSNLSIKTGALARRIVFENKRARAVEFAADGLRYRASANAEVILCAGAINTPQLL